MRLLVRVEVRIRVKFGFRVWFGLSVHSNPYLIFGVYLVRIHKQKKKLIQRGNKIAYLPPCYLHTAQSSLGGVRIRQDDAADGGR